MARYTARDIKDRIATGDDRFIMTNLDIQNPFLTLDPETGHLLMSYDPINVSLTPNPTSITEPGTEINKALLQLMEDRIVYLMNFLFDDLTSNPFTIEFNTLSGINTDGVWNVENERIEC